MIEEELSPTIRLEIEKKIKELGKQYRQMKGLILTESDLKCLLFCKLLTIDGLSVPMETKDTNISSIAIHSELSWFDKNHKLTIKPDISIINPRRLSILKENEYSFKLPSKGYSFGGYAIVLELKFVKTKNGITNYIFYRSIKKDFEKIERLKQKLQSQNMPSNIFCYFVIFNKTNMVCREFEGFLENNEQGVNHKIIYETGNIVFG